MIKQYLNYYPEEDIVGEKTILRKLSEKDLEKSLVWFRDSAVNKFLSHNFCDFTKEQEIQWFRFIQNSKRDLLFSINTKDEHLHIGNCGLHKINWVRKSCELGIVIGEKNCWNKGYGTDAIKSMVNFAFNKLNLLKIQLNVYEYNFRAIKSYKKSGFKIVKVLRKNHFYNGNYWDTLIMELTKR